MQRRARRWKNPSICLHRSHLESADPTQVATAEIELADVMAWRAVVRARQFSEDPDAYPRRLDPPDFASAEQPGLPGVPPRCGGSTAAKPLPTFPDGTCSRCRLSANRYGVVRLQTDRGGSGHPRRPSGGRPRRSVPALVDGPDGALGVHACRRCRVPPRVGGSAGGRRFTGLAETGQTDQGQRACIERGRMGRVSDPARLVTPRSRNHG